MGSLEERAKMEGEGQEEERRVSVELERSEGDGEEEVERGMREVSSSPRSLLLPASSFLHNIFFYLFAGEGLTFSLGGKEVKTLFPRLCKNERRLFQKI